MVTASLTGEVVQFIERTTLADIPAPVVQRAKTLVTDFLGVAVAGSVEPQARIVHRFLDEHGGGGTATVIGCSERTTVPWSALANGVAGHALDFDDVSQTMYGHPTVAVLPAALAAAELVGCGGSTLLESYIIGVEVAVKLASSMKPAHYQKGWHSTSTLGSLGATAAAAKLLRLRGPELHSALALGASQACGLQQNFGTMTKTFHAGRAAQNGIVAALLAQKGFTGDQAILEAPLGFFQVFSGPGNFRAEEAVHRLGKPFEIEDPGLILKKHPCCAFSHPSVDAALEIAARPNFDLSKVDRVEAYIHHLANQVLIHMRPKTGLEAKFSLEGCLALALVDKGLSIRSFIDRSIARAEIQAIIGRVQRRVIPREKCQPTDFGPATVRVCLADGHTLEGTVEKAKGTPERPMRLEETEAKYHDCCSGVLSEGVVERSMALLERLERLDRLDELMACYRMAS